MVEFAPPQVPSSTYRLQFHPKFGFKDATQLSNYLIQLGIGACYCSPILQAEPGSAHGYDTCNHNRLNSDLGTIDDFDLFAESLASNKIGLIVDFVPNHMSANAENNPWWRNVLESGPWSPYAHFFDIDWDPLKPELKGKVLLPILGNQYGQVLESGDLQVDTDNGKFILRYFDRHLPLNLSGEVPADIHALHALLERQSYRVAYWRTAMHEINYRRFFDINALVGLRMEDPTVFEAAHKLLLSLVHRGLINGLRLDHVDGLFNPAEYFERLAQAVGPDRKCYIVAEKILSQEETLPVEWRIDGTTGYEFLNVLNGIFVDVRNAQKVKRNYERFSGIRDLFSDTVYESKKLIISTSLASELNILAHELNRISETNWLYRDFTLDSLQEAVREIVACFPVYRTYVTSNGWSAFDERQVDIAVARALRRNPAMESSTFTFVREMLLPTREGITEEEFQRRLTFAMKFQQYTGPVQAKGVEDTAFYRYAPLLSLNEVGGDPLRFGRSVEEFHANNQDRHGTWPFSMLATSTHDTKRGEDARLRINVLSELPETCRTSVAQWARINGSKRTTVDGRPAPARRDEYFFYQALLGSWPIDEDFEPDSEFIQRFQQYMSKTTREAKIHTSWINPNESYDSAIAEFVKRTLLDKRFLQAFRPFAQQVAVYGAINSLAQLVLKIASPGVPDFYQGTELWDLNLVDPDNRRPVNYDLRLKLMGELVPLIDNPDPAASGALLSQWRTGAIKLYITACGLRLRKAKRDLFLTGEYIPIGAEGSRREHVVAFARRNGDELALVIAPRLPVSLTWPDRIFPVGSSVWQDTSITLPDAVALRNVLTGERISKRANLMLSDALSTLSVGLWVTDQSNYD